MVQKWFFSESAFNRSGNFRPELPSKTVIWHDRVENTWQILHLVCLLSCLYLGYAHHFSSFDHTLHCHTGMFVTRGKNCLTTPHEEFRFQKLCLTCLRNYDKPFILGLIRTTGVD